MSTQPFKTLYVIRKSAWRLFGLNWFEIQTGQTICSGQRPDIVTVQLWLIYSSCNYNQSNKHGTCVFLMLNAVMQHSYIQMKIKHCSKSEPLKMWSNWVQQEHVLSYGTIAPTLQKETGCTVQTPPRIILIQPTVLSIASCSSVTLVLVAHRNRASKVLVNNITRTHATSLR